MIFKILGTCIRHSPGDNLSRHMLFKHTHISLRLWDFPALVYQLFLSSILELVQAGWEAWGVSAEQFTYHGILNSQGLKSMLPYHYHRL
jgi:hypothetical protein